MGIISIDLGTTNIKVASYTNEITPLNIENYKVHYMRDGYFVEFNPEKYFSHVMDLIKKILIKSNLIGDKIQLVVTGQAESLVVVDKYGKPLYNGISWLDMRSREECKELSEKFDSETCYRITGQPEITPTWPLTKILWLKKNNPDIFKRIAKFLLIKDYILYKLTGRFVGEHSIYPFSYYFDIVKKQYWLEALAYCGVSMNQLPELIEPCSIVGDVMPNVLEDTNLSAGSYVNSGTLDHFAAMIGTGNIDVGFISESAGTVSSIATFVKEPFISSSHIPIYCGPFENSYIYLPVCESGGASLEWFQKRFLPEISFSEIDNICANRKPDPRLTFLPYITGVNPPEFDPMATGVFYGANIAHDSYDFALSIMYGVASLLRKNIDYFRKSDIAVEKIISTGGGAKSELWAQIKADICNIPVIIPENQEASCLGAGIIAAVSSGIYKNYHSAISACVKMNKIFTPTNERNLYEDKYHLFNSVYKSLSPVFKL